MGFRVQQTTQGSASINSVGIGVSLVVAPDSVKSLIAGTGIGIVNNGNDVTITNTNTFTGYASVANYSALPSASAHNSETYEVLASQGTAWLPGSLGGTYYSAGFYYSNGITWNYLGSAPYQASQSDVNAGLITDQFVSPNTLLNITATISGLTAGTVITNANLTGQATSLGNAVTLTNSAVISKVLTGYISGAGTISATDTILQAIQKLNGNIGSITSSQWIATGSDIYYSAGNVMIGQASAPTSKLHIVETSTSTPRGILADQYSTTGGSRITMRTAGGTFGSPSAVGTGRALGSWTVSGHDGTNFVESSKILVTSIGTIGTSQVPSTMAFQTMTAGGTLTTGILIDQAQHITLEGVTSTGATGTGKFVFDTSPILVTPALGTPSSGLATNLTGLPLTTGVTGVLGTANGGTGIANNAASTWTISGSFATTITVSAATGVTLPTSGTLYGTKSGSITSSQMLSSMFDPTGTGANVFSTSPTLITPLLGTPTSGVLTNCTGYTGVNLVLTDVTTNNSSTSNHGFLAKLSNTATQYMDGSGNWSTPTGTTYSFSTGLTNSAGTVTNNLSVGVSGGQTTIGGTAVGDGLIFKGTTANGTSSAAAFTFNGGNNGGTTLATMLNNGNIGIGVSPTARFHIGAIAGANGGVLLDLLANSGTAGLSYASIDFNVPTTGLIGQFFATASNYSSTALLANSIGLFAEATSGQLALGSLGTSGTVDIFTGGNALINKRFSITAKGAVSFAQSANTAGAVTGFTYTAPANTAQTTGSEINGILWTTTSRQWAGSTTVATQREFYITAPTYSSASATKTITDAFTFYVDAGPTQGTNTTLTRAWSAGFNGRVGIASNLYIGGLTTAATALIHLGAGTATASTAPIKLTTGTNLTAAEAGVLAEYDGINFYGTPNTTVGRWAYSFNSVQYSTPTTGSTVVSTASIANLVCNPAGTLLALTITFPASPVNGQTFGIAISQIITTLTLNTSDGSTIDGTITTSSINSNGGWVYIASATTWFKVH